jgi:hypothetical protein
MRNCTYNSKRHSIGRQETTSDKEIPGVGRNLRDNQALPDFVGRRLSGLRLRQVVRLKCLFY